MPHGEPCQARRGADSQFLHAASWRAARQFHMRVFALVIVLLAPFGPGCRRSVAPPPPAPVGPVTVPAGTVLPLRVAQTIDSDASRPGQTFAAVVTRDIDNPRGQTVLPDDSPSTLVLLRGRTQGTFEIGIALVTLNGDAFLVGDQHLGVFLGGVRGAGSAPSELALSGKRVWAPLGSLLTFRLGRPLVLLGSH